MPITTLGPHNYCVILDPVGPDGKNQLGQKRVVKGEKSFFLQPGEQLEQGIQDVYVLSEQQGLLLRALQPLEEGRMKRRSHTRLGTTGSSVDPWSMCHLPRWRWWRSARPSL